MATAEVWGCLGSLCNCVFAVGREFIRIKILRPYFLIALLIFLIHFLNHFILPCSLIPYLTFLTTSLLACLFDVYLSAFLPVPQLSCLIINFILASLILCFPVHWRTFFFIFIAVSHVYCMFIYMFFSLIQIRSKLGVVLRNLNYLSTAIL